MKLLVTVLTVLLFTGAEAASQCIQGKDGEVAHTPCTKTDEAKCSGPKFVEYTGLSTGIEYKCGACADQNTLDKTCTECTATTDGGCNKPEVTDVDFACYTHTYDDNKSAFVQAADKATCKRLEDTDIVCNQPGESAAKATYSSSGCGPCKPDDVTAKTCKECTSDSCNAAPTCNKPTIQDGSVSPATATITSGKAYTASCDSGFTMTGTATVTCTDGTLSAVPTCATEGKKFKCYSYKYITADKAFAKEDTAIDCTGADIKCNQPGEDATEALYKLDGCGGCGADALTAKTCKECTTDSCNSAMKPAIFIAAIVSLLFTLF